MRLPDYRSAPEDLLTLPSACGPVSAWMVLRHFAIDAPAAALLQACRYTEEHGTFLIALAVGLHEQDLRVTFYTDPDDHPNPLEQTCYRLARHHGIPVRPALGLHEALSMINPERIGLVCYDTPEGEGHISPLTGHQGDDVLLPLDPAGRLPASAFEQRWQAPEILRQLVLVSRQDDVVRYV